MVLQILILVVGFVLLIKGADVFVDGASNVARNFHLSKMFIGLTIVAFGTSAPEFAVSVKAMLSGSGDIVLGNVLGSNILNILLILGVASLIHPLQVKSQTVRKEIPITMMLSILLFVLMDDHLFDGSLNNALVRNDGIALVLFFMVFIYYLISMMRRRKDMEDGDSDVPWKLSKAILYTVLGIVAIIFGSQFVVDGATEIATILGVSERMIALTVVAFGTSLPELVTSVIATKKGEYDIAIGNVVGSNIFNIGIVLGLPLTILGGSLVGTFSSLDLIVFLLSIGFLFFFSWNDEKITGREGILFLLVFIGYYGYVIFA